MREYTITIYKDGGWTARDSYGQIFEPILLGYDGEDEATELTVNLPSDWTGSFYLDWFYDEEWHEGSTAYTDTEITYNVTSDEIVIGDVYFRVRIEDGGTTMYSDPIQFQVKP